MQENGANVQKKESFLKRKGVVISVKTYFIDAMSTMALGLFASLLIGTIMDMVGKNLNIPFLIEVANQAKAATGPAMGVAIAFALKAPPLVMFSAAAVGLAGNAIGKGGPLSALISTIVAVELGKLVSKETKVDIIVTPTVTIIAGVTVAMLVGPMVGGIMRGFGQIVMLATEMQPIAMGIIVSVVVGIVLTLPISSAALCIMLELGGLAAGAATAGCCAQMMGFAVASFKENGWGGFFAQGLGTSMLQVGNIVRNPRIWIAPTLAAAVTGPIATVVFGMKNIPTGAGMGTSGLVGPLGVIAAMEGGAMMWIGILLICFILPAVLTWGFDRFFRKIGWVKDGDQKLDL